MKNKMIGYIIYGVTALCTAFIIFVIVYLLVTIFINGKGNLTWQFLTESPSEGMTAGGIFPAIVGTFFLVIVMTLIGVPIGTITAIYLNEYASKKQAFFVRTIRFAVNTLAGVPSIVFGLFGLGFFIQFIGAGIDKSLYHGELLWGQPCLFWAGMTMAFLTIPVVIVSVEEALKNVPDDLRAGSLALGATRWQTIYKIVLPNAMSGIMTGTILAISRGAGEVAPILFTGAAYFLPKLPGSLTDQFMNLGYHIYVMSTQSTDVEATKGIQFATVLVLLAITFGLNLIAVIIRYRHRMKNYNYS